LGGVVAVWSVGLPLDQVLCSWARHLTLTVPHSSQHPIQEEGRQ